MMTKIVVLLGLASVLPFFSLSSFSLATQKPESAALEEQVKAGVTRFKGKVIIFAKNLDNGKTFALNADDRVRTASTIKIAVMVEAFARVAAGKARWTDDLLLTKEKKVSGSGILKEMSEGLKNIKILRRVGSGGESPGGEGPGQLPALNMASKYGALDHLRSASGIIYSEKGRIAIAIACDQMPEVKWSVDNPAYLFISRVSESKGSLPPECQLKSNPQKHTIHEDTRNNQRICWLPQDPS